MPKSCLSFAFAWVLGGMAWAASPAESVRQQAILPDAVLVLDGDLAAFGKAPLVARLKAALVKRDGNQDRLPLARAVSLWLGEGSHLIFSCRYKEREQNTDLAVRAWLESATPGLLSRTQKCLNGPNGFPLQASSDGKVLSLSLAGSPLGLSEAGNGLAFSWCLAPERPGGQPASREKAEALLALMKKHAHGQVTLALQCSSYSVRRLLIEPESGMNVLFAYSRGDAAVVWRRLWSYLDLDLLAQMEQAVISLDAGDNLQVNITGIFLTEDEADMAARALARHLGILYGKIEQESIEAEGPQGVVPNPMLPASLKQLVESSSMNRQGRLLSLQLTFPASLLIPDEPKER